MQEITLAQVLAARENRVRRQQELLAQYGVPLICFTMNIAGPVKNSPLIFRAFSEGCRQLKERLCEPVLFWQSETAATGCVLYCAVKGEAAAIKRICTAIEDETALGRLFDMDVLDVAGKKLDREDVGGKDRGCLVCGKAGRGCASRRVHSVAELQAATRQIITHYFQTKDARVLAALTTHALLDEVHTTPKPGLVDEANTGSHRDMNLHTFEQSIAALTPYWAQCVEIGQKTAGLPPQQTFLLLRAAGLEAEQAMFAVTNGVNTHKGAIFTLGVLCGAAGRLWTAENPRPNIESVLLQCTSMTKTAMEADFEAIDATPEDKLTAGGRIYRQYGLRGIRGEVADGLPSVKNVSLPALKATLAAGKSHNDAGAIALLHLIALGTDTNMISRGGMEQAAQAAKQVRDLLKKSPMPSAAEIAALDRDFIRKNLSAGGCADLLAATYFLHDYEKTA